MNWNDLELAWRQEPLPEDRHVDLLTLRRTFESKSKKQARDLFVRDLRQTLAGLIVTGFIAYYGFRENKAYWLPLGLAVLPLLGVTLYCLRELVRGRKLRLGSDAPLLARLDADIAELGHRRHLLLHVAPLLIGAIAAAGGTMLATVVVLKSPMLRGESIRIACSILLFPLLVWIAIVRNRWDARKLVEPRIAELTRLRNDLVAMS